MNISQVIQSCTERLEAAGIETARLDAEVLLGHTLGKSRAEIYLDRNDEVDDVVLRAIDEAVSMRSDGCPVAYITGVKEFWSIPIRVTKEVLVPRPDTETVVDEAIKLSKDFVGDIRVLDLCTGSGCIAAALAREMPRTDFVLTDKSDEALEIARENLAFAAERVEVRQGDLFEALSIGSRFEMIVTNPPYICEEEIPSLSREIRDFEPMGALSGGKSGLDFVSRIIEDAPRFMVPGGWLLMEIGEGQAGATVSMATTSDRYDTVRIAKDLAGIERVVLLRKNTLDTGY